MSIAYPMFGLYIGVPLMVVGCIILSVWFSTRKKPITNGSKTHVFVVGLVLVIFGAALFAANWLIIYVDQERMRHMMFEYNAVLEINGTGRASVSLPMPTADWLWSDLEFTPSTSTVSTNGSGPEPAFEVILSENTTLHAMAFGLVTTTPVNLTRTSEFNYGCYPNDCTSEISVMVLEGNISDVHVVLDVYWSTLCYGGTWELECKAFPGHDEYPGEWLPRPCP